MTTVIPNNLQILAALRHTYDLFLRVRVRCASAAADGEPFTRGLNAEPFLLRPELSPAMCRGHPTAADPGPQRHKHRNPVRHIRRAAADRTTKYLLHKIGCYKAGQHIKDLIRTFFVEAMRRCAVKRNFLFTSPQAPSSTMVASTIDYAKRCWLQLSAFCKTRVPDAGMGR
ncbi:hypothetical protein ACJJTC_011195 [Scirpophaga incertulas]